MSFETFVNEFVFGTRTESDLPGAAIKALEEGNDSPSLRQLAGAVSSEPEELKRLLRLALAELHLRRPSPQEAGLAMAQHIAGDILQGAIDPYEGARKIWSIYIRQPQLKRLTIFVGLASEYEDHPASREDLARDILEECRELLAMGG